MTDAHNVTVYSTPTCPWCDRAKEYLTSRDVPFTNKDVSVDQEAAMEMIRLTGQQGVPVITAGNDVVVGSTRSASPRSPTASAAPPTGPRILGADASDY
jgi:glutaredoxin